MYGKRVEYNLPSFKLSCKARLLILRFAHPLQSTLQIGFDIFLILKHYPEIYIDSKYCIAYCFYATFAEPVI